MAITEQDSDNSFFPIWPPSFTANIQDASLTEVYDSAGESVGAVGDEISLGGGEIETLKGSGPMIPTSAHETIDNLCPGKFWIVGGVIARGTQRE